jgi:hypothetical protein
LKEVDRLEKVEVVGGGESPRRGKVEEDGSVGECRSGSRR